LLNAAAVFEVRAGTGGVPEAEGGNGLLLFGTVEQIERDDAGGDCADETKKFAEPEIQEVHLRNGSCVY
jgi:hypothetical protein